MRLRKIISALALAMSIAFTSCGVTPVIDEKTQEDDDMIEIGMCFDSYVIERWQKDRDVFVSTAQSLGATVNVQNANGEVDKQIEQIEYFIEKGVDCLVIIPVDCSALSEQIATAKEKGIAVISYDRLIDDADADLYISFDNYMVGQLMAQAIADDGAKSVLMINGPLTDNNVPMVIDAFTKIADENDIEIVDQTYATGWKAELGAAYVYENTDKAASVDAIMCGNDDIATAVIRALAVSQLAGVTTVVGQDADLTACQHIVEGTQTMTVYKPVEKLASEAAELAVKLAQGQDIDVPDTINDGSYDIPYMAIEPIAVTKDNMDEVIIDGGFHGREEVYMNVLSAEDEMGTDSEDSDITGNESDEEIEN